MEKTEVPTNTPQSEASEAQIAALLEYQFGDGLVYLPKIRGRSLDTLARQRGYIDSQGYLTRKGRALLARYHYM